MLQPHQIKVMKDRWHWEKEFSDLCSLVARHVATAEIDFGSGEDYYRSQFYELLHTRKFSPNTPTWINAGRDIKGSLSACFVYNIEDTMESILDSSRWLGMVQKFGGGTGFDLSALRARGVKIRSTHGKACGPIAVLKHLAATSQMVTQGGVRDGANMAVLSVYHADVMDFISLKARESKFMLEIPKEYAQLKLDSGQWTLEQASDYIEYCRLNGLYQLFNVSIAVDKEFMSAVQEYEQHKTKVISVEGTCSYDKLLPCGRAIGQVWDAIVEQAWSSGDPGILFLDRAQEIAKTQSPMEIRATNPCGEQFLPHMGSCNLGSIDLSKFFLENPFKVSGVANIDSLVKGSIDWIELARVIALSVRFLDNIVEINVHADSGITEVNNLERRIGLGIMGWADLLVKLNIPYDTENALRVGHIVGEFFDTQAHLASERLGKERGPFPLWEQVTPNASRRNSTVTTVAPTGTISIVAGCSSGIEPHFHMAYEHKGLKESGGLGLIWASETLKDISNKIKDDHPGGSFMDYWERNLRSKYQWKPANEISISWHIRHQAMWQKYIDNSISKTLNLPNDATRENVSDAYLQAWFQGCKGSTVYRDGCKPNQPLNAPKNSQTNDPESVLKALGESLGEAVGRHGAILAGPVEVEVTHVLEHQPPKKSKRPRWVTSETAKVETAEGDLYITITHDDRGMPFEVFAQLGKGGTSTAAGVEALNRTISIGLRYGVNPFEYIKQLRGIKSMQHGMGPNAIFSIPDAIGQMLEEYMVRTFGEDWAAEEGWTSNIREEPVPLDTSAAPLFKTLTSDPQYPIMTESCPECGSQMVHAEGCHGGTCLTCGYTKCS